MFSTSKYLLNDTILSLISCYIFSISSIIEGFTVTIFLLIFYIRTHCAEKAKLGMS